MLAIEICLPEKKQDEMLNGLQRRQTKGRCQRATQKDVGSEDGGRLYR